MQTLGTVVIPAPATIPPHTHSADQITFTASTAISAQWATPVAGSITDTWWRASWGSVTGTFAFVVVVSIL